MLSLLSLGLHRIPTFLPLQLSLRCLSSSKRNVAPLSPKARAAPTPSSKPGLLYRESDIVEQFVRGSGAGGQSVARTANCVILKHLPSGIMVRCHATRSRDLNRKAARRELQLRLDTALRGKHSVRGKRASKAIKAKAKKRARTLTKYGVEPQAARRGSSRGTRGRQRKAGGHRAGSLPFPLPRLAALFRRPVLAK